MTICDFGCGNEALYQFKSGKWCCESTCNKCEGFKTRMSEKKKGVNVFAGKDHPRGMKGKKPWNQGLTKENSNLVKLMTEKSLESNRKNQTCFGKGSKHTQETKEAIAIRMRGNKNGKHQGNKNCWYAGLRMDSKWEVAVAHYFDQNNVQWFYEKETYQITEKSSYTPDFFIYEGDKLVKIVEVKGYWRKENLEKFQAFQKLYPDVVIEVWNKQKLYDLGLINKAGYVNIIVDNV